MKPFASSLRRRSLAFAFFALVGGIVPSTKPLRAQPIPPDANEQIANFSIPDGFEIQLVLSDPDIGQPMNLNFDARGRLWVTHSIEYPYPANSEGVEPDRGRFAGGGENPPRDRLTVAGIGEDGRAFDVKHFASGLNIPIGQTPLGDGDAALVYAIPSIFHVIDRDGDGIADQRDPLYSRFGNVDVHGNASSFTRWIDGWVYGCHGFSNQSEIADSNGGVTRLRSGNTYRFRSDGSRFEKFTSGQVNPFGITFDPLGNLFDSDCHSKPVYQLLRGATYPHFGDKPPAVGFGPTMIDHAHGSTGICGPAYYAADHFPAEYRDNIFICNPVTGRVHRDRLRRVGSTLLCDTQPDFITTPDPWFRPVDAIVGPDGALYIADFCNLIIGHYEAPLDHPDRDRTHGRVWRIVWLGDAQTQRPGAPIDLTKKPTDELVELLNHPNLQVRTLATNYLVDCRSDEVTEILKKRMQASEYPAMRAHGMWILERLGQLDDSQLRRLVEDVSPLVRVHAMKVIAERVECSASQLATVRQCLNDSDAFVQRAAAQALGQHLHEAGFEALMSALSQASTDDTHYVHAMHLAVNRHFADPSIVAAIRDGTWSDEWKGRVVERAAASDAVGAAEIVLALADPKSMSPELILRAASQIAISDDSKTLNRLINEGRNWYANDTTLQLRLITAIVDGFVRNGLSVDEYPDLRDWLSAIAGDLLAQLQQRPASWSREPIAGLVPVSESPWGIRHRASADGHPDALYWDSITHGESLTGILRSAPLVIPESFTFWMCGHNGHPAQQQPAVNHVRLRLADTGKVIAREEPPRNDVARKYEWNLSEHVGKRGILEVVDAHQAGAYAWLAIGRFDPPVLQVAEDHASLRVVELAGLFQLTQHRDLLLQIAANSDQSNAVRHSAIEALNEMKASTELRPLATALLNDTDAAANLRILAIETLGKIRDRSSEQVLTEAIASSPAQLQSHIALALSHTNSGLEQLLLAIEQGKASARLLREPRMAEATADASSTQRQRIAGFISALRPVSDQIAERLAFHQQILNSRAMSTSSQRGRGVFEKNCAACHRIGDLGQLIGPQLDGVGNRGGERLLEDILDPNRNVDVAFRGMTIVTIDGSVIHGLLRRQEGKSIVIADQTGREHTIAEADIEVRKPSDQSVMPGNFAEILNDQQMQDLLAYLLEQRSSATSDGKPKS
ncbi:MAG: HEAT repeat domain-containing protein [Pirellulaceae bacterium]